MIPDPVHDTVVLTRRSLRHVLRSPDTIISTALMPIAFLLLFVYVLGGAIQAGPGRYVDYLLPGILFVTIASGIAYTAFRLYLDVRGGIFERLASMPIARTAVLWAHVLTSVVANLVSVVVVVGVALLMGFRSDAGVVAWLEVAGLVLVVTLALTWVAVVPGLLAASPDGASAFSYPLVFLPFVSSAFVPTASMPGPVRAFADHQPVTSTVDTLRDLLAGHSPGTGVVTALAWWVAIAVLGATVAWRVFGRRTRPRTRVRRVAVPEPAGSLTKG